MNLLNKASLEKINGNVVKPTKEVLELPEKVLQFGTGVLLRGLPDFFIDKANREGNTYGRIVVVKSTDQGDTSAFDNQDNLYTVCVRGIEDGVKKEENIINSSISRVLTASTQWEQILDVAASAQLELVISNTTEVGIQYVEDNILSNPPVSYPGKLLAVLYHRFKMFNGAADKGLVIIPTELISDNGTKLKEVLAKLIAYNNLSEDFIKWLETANTICNSLVDRIVPGKPDTETLATLEQELGYKDNLLTMSEVYSLWAIEGDENLAKKLKFAASDKGVVITPDIHLHKELKLRLLNGTHTLSCGAAYLAECGTVKEAMDYKAMEDYISDLMKSEIAPAIPYDVMPELAVSFANKVLDRFRNPHIKHQWLSITMNYTSKLAMRVIPVLLNYAKTQTQVPQLMAFGFAAYIHFMKGSLIDGKYYGELNGNQYLINDDKASILADLWVKNGVENIADAVLSNVELWGEDLTTINGFAAEVDKLVKEIEQSSVKEVLNKISNK